METDSNSNKDEKELVIDQEKEKQLNEENIKEKICLDDDENLSEKKDDAENEKNGKTGGVEKMKQQLEESQKSGPAKIRVPIGGIKIPGFLRSLSRDNKTKDTEVSQEEGTDLLEIKVNGEEVAKTTDDTTAQNQRNFQQFYEQVVVPKWEWLMTKPYPKPETVKSDEQSVSFLNRLPAAAVAVLPKRFIRSDKKDIETGKNDDEKSKTDDDGMESVQLDNTSDNNVVVNDKYDINVVIENAITWPQWCPNWLKKFYYYAYHTRTRLERILYPALLAILIIIIISLCFEPSPPIRPPVIDGKILTSTQCGPVEGLQQNDVFVFRNIPYAAPPVGDRRWKPAQPLNNLSLCWTEQIYSIKNYSNRCWQRIGDDRIDGQEDCLTLDIYTPDVRYLNPMPVVVLIDTLTLAGGPPGVLNADPKILKTEEVVFVKPNFRLGILGFLASRALTLSTHPPSSGNYGLWDIIVALKWVQANIEHFGGDPKQVTLVGHKAGATLVTVLAASPLAKNLFVRAWASSGSSMFPGENLTLSESANQDYVESLCPMSDIHEQVNCLKSKSAERLMKDMDNTWPPAVVDLPKDVEDHFNSHSWLASDGNIIRTHLWSSNAQWIAPLIIGTTAHSEVSQGLWSRVRNNMNQQGDPIGAHVRKSALDSLGLANRALQRYNATLRGLVQMVTDIRTTCPLLVMARAKNVTFYLATRSRNHTDFGDLADADTDMSAIMGTYNPSRPEQQQYVKTLKKFFYDYVKYGKLPTENRTSPQAYITVNETISWVNDHPDCNFWVSEKIVPNYSRRD